MCRMLSCASAKSHICLQHKQKLPLLAIFKNSATHFKLSCNHQTLKKKHPSLHGQDKSNALNKGPKEHFSQNITANIPRLSLTPRALHGDQMPYVYFTPQKSKSQLHPQQQ